MDVNGLRTQVLEAFSALASQPTQQSPFPVGRALAEGVGYPPTLLDALPASSVEAFCGVAPISLTAELCPGMQVLDLGCGAGLDSLVAGRRVAPTGQVIGVDFSAAMLERATQSVAEGVSFRRGDAEQLPLPDASVDVALVNGIFNLNPGRQAIFGELFRVLRPGGAVFAAELILTEPLQAAESWFT